MCSIFKFVFPFIYQVLIAAVVVIVDWFLYAKATEDEWWTSIQPPKGMPSEATFISLTMLFVAFSLAVCIVGSYTSMKHFSLAGQFCRSACWVAIGLSLWNRRSFTSALVFAILMAVIILAEFGLACVKSKFLGLLLIYPLAWNIVVIVMIARAINDNAHLKPGSEWPHTAAAETLRRLADVFQQSKKHFLSL